MTYMESICVKKSDLLILGSLVSRDDDKLRREIGVVADGLSRRGEAREYQQSGLQISGREGRHVEDIVVSEQQEVMGIVESLDVVHVVLQHVPVPVKLVDGQRWQRPNTRLYTNAHQALWKQITAANSKNIF